MEVTGTITVIMETQEFDSGFTKREFVIKTEDQYPQVVKFETIKDKTALLDDLKVNDKVSVAFNLKGNEYEGKYYVNLQAWKIGKLEADAAPAAASQEVVTEAENDDLPF